VKEYEREAHVDGVDAKVIKATRADMVNTVNKYVSMKKEVTVRAAARDELLAGPSQPPPKRDEGARRPQPSCARLSSCPASQPARVLPTEP